MIFVACKEKQGAKSIAGSTRPSFQTGSKQAVTQSLRQIALLPA